MTERHEHGLSTADLAAATPEPENAVEDRETGRTDGHDLRDSDAYDRDTRDTETYATEVPEQGMASHEEGELEPAPPGDPAGTAMQQRPEAEGVSSEPLFDEAKVTGYRERWQHVQTGFVDDPHQAVREADELVAGVISALAETFAEHKRELEAEWREGEPATEELRVALRRYRSFFDQLLPS